LLVSLQLKKLNNQNGLNFTLRIHLKQSSTWYWLPTCQQSLAFKRNPVLTNFN